MRILAVLLLAHVSAVALAADPLLPPQKLLENERFWDNRDWDWYRANIPFFECPDSDIQTTYYYRWELLTKHLTYGSPNSGYSFTEFIDRPFWSGAYGAISCPAGHQLYEARWLRDPRIARDYSRYWFRTPGAQPRNYSTWLADSVWAVHQIHPNPAFITTLLPDLKKNHEGWENRHFVKDVGMFWQTGHDDGMEFNINSRQTKDILRGAPGYRPTINAYMWADELAIAKVAELAGDTDTAKAFRAKAAGLKEKLHAKLWDPRRRFFFPMFKQDEEADGQVVKALTLTYQSGKHAGSEYGRELIGYVPWQFGMIDKGKGYEEAWKKLIAADAFAATYGPSTVERNDPMFLLKNSCCWWSGQSWPYATSQTLKAMANVLQDYDQTAITAKDYVSLLHTFAITHRKNGKPYLAEACHPDTGSFEGHDGYNHSEHYFHSSFNDLIITGLVGLRPRDDDMVEVKPLAPAEWDYFALDQVPYKGQMLSLFWDRDGSRYKKGQGFHVLVNGKEVSSSRTLKPILVPLPNPKIEPVSTKSASTAVNFAVNNDGSYFPRISATYTSPRTSTAKLVDGNYWYHRDPPNRWTCEGSPNTRDSVSLDFGIERSIHSAKLYFLDDGKGIVPPQSFTLKSWDGGQWKALAEVKAPSGHRAPVVSFPPRKTSKLRATFTHAQNGKTGLTEFEAWGDTTLPLADLAPPAGNIAYNPGDRPFPKATASYADRFGGKPMLAIDGKTNFLPTPTNRWTSYESPNLSDWLEIDFGEPKAFQRIELAIYDDRGGVQAPTQYHVEVWDGNVWTPVKKPTYAPEKPIGGQFNEVKFERTTARKVRVVFTHAGKARSGVSELLIWSE
ncbi:MAG: discoidin domain-containing protein [Gemmataceae bacterium]